jgi:hypothetical protein
MENTIQEGPLKRNNGRLVLVNTYDKLCKKRAGDIMSIRHDNSALTRVQQMKKSYLWGKATKIDTKKLEDNIPLHIRLSQPQNPQTKEYLIKTLQPSADLEQSVMRTSHMRGTQSVFPSSKPAEKNVQKRLDFKERSNSEYQNRTSNNSYMIKTGFGLDKTSTMRNTKNQLNSTRDMSSMRSTKGKICHKKTTQPRKILPKELRDNPFCNLPVLMDEDLNSGLLALLNQGLIPKDVDVSPALDRDDPVLRTTKIEKGNFRAHEQSVEENYYLDTGLFITRQGHIEYNGNEGPRGKMKQTGFYSSKEEDSSSWTLPHGKHFQPNVYAMEDEIKMVDGNQDLEKNVNFAKTTTTARGFSLGHKRAVSDSTAPPAASKLNTKELVEMLNRMVLRVSHGKVDEANPIFLKFKTKYFHVWGDIKMVLILIEKL